MAGVVADLVSVVLVAAVIALAGFFILDMATGLVRMLLGRPPKDYEDTLP